MTMPYYVAPEQVMKDRAEYAQKGIARGRSLVATVTAEGYATVPEEAVAASFADLIERRRSEGRPS